MTDINLFRIPYDQPEGNTNNEKQTKDQAYLMGALEFEKTPYLWNHSYSPVIDGYRKVCKMTIK